MSTKSKREKPNQLGTIDLLGVSVSDGRYEVKEVLGKGSMGYVYLALDHNLDTEVVLKVPTLARLENPDFRRRFLQESRFLVRLTHPSIISIMDVGEYNEIPYFVMQYVNGGSLEDRQFDDNQVKQKLGLKSLNTWLPGMSAALDFMHAKKCVHRDVKPANILFDEHGNPFLSDFGLSKLIVESDDQDDSSMTAAGAVVGTPSYVAPEIVLGREYDGRADQYSLATTVYEILTGIVPMEGPSASATMVNQTNKELTNPREHNPKITPEIAKVILKGMSRSYLDRYPTCEAFSTALLNAIDHKKNMVPGAKYVVKATSKGEKGKVPCPACKKVLILKPAHRGKRAKCSKCDQHLVVGKNLTELQLIERIPGRGHGSSQDEITTLVGQEVFGYKLSPKQSLLALIVLIVVSMIGLFITLQRMKADELEERNRFRVKVKQEQAMLVQPLTMMNYS